ncbi:hypothetical protein O3Q52_13430 [Streptomyces sp. ActVer]|uniref:hypothetical protein n=1 Tax=Streptomyces sp. ActVer TaxID=3014558 RepID=UPI0022B35F72|nr:hypothetical protein [Streptomyces sp. ActVer]MCZ4509187.1 hypothetical protein [Streptomyces sp. ActVer]
MRTIYDGGGKPHVIGAPQDNASEKLAFKYMNEDLELAGKYYDNKTRTGSMYLWQDDGAGQAEPRTYADKNGNVRITGATADYVKVTWKNGQIVNVETWDATESTRSAGNLAGAETTVRNKMDAMGRKAQSENVVFVAKDFDQASEMRDRFANHGNVCIIHPDSHFDTMRQAPLVRRVSGGTIRITPGEQVGRGGTGTAPAAPRTPNGSAGGKFLNGAGVFGELFALYQFAKEWNTIGNGGCVPMAVGDCQSHEM